MLSKYKWGQLVELARMHGLIQIFEVIRGELRQAPVTGFADLYDFGHIHLQSRTLDKELQDIIRKEYIDPEKSYETMQVMAIIVSNAAHILTGRSYLKGIIDLGRYLRLEGGKVDFVKLDDWLKRTRMTGMALLKRRAPVCGEIGEPSLARAAGGHQPQRPQPAPPLGTPREQGRLCGREPAEGHPLRATLTPVSALCSTRDLCHHPSRPDERHH